jgi:hypothetical protein
MTPQIQLDFAGIHLQLTVDERGIDWQSGPRHQFVEWKQITGAVLLKEDRERDLSAAEIPEVLVQRFGGAEGLAKILELQTRYGQIRLAYRDRRNAREALDIPYDKEDSQVLNEVKNRLGSRWLGEVPNSKIASEKLKLNPGFFKTSLFLIVFLSVIILAAGFLLNAFLAPVFNLLSVQRMLLNLQDGEYGAFASSFSIYACLFVLAYVARRAWRVRATARQTRSLTRNPHFLFDSSHNS